MENALKYLKSESTIKSIQSLKEIVLSDAFYPLFIDRDVKVISALGELIELGGERSIGELCMVLFDELSDAGEREGYDFTMRELLLFILQYLKISL